MCDPLPKPWGTLLGRGLTTRAEPNSPAPVPSCLASSSPALGYYTIAQTGHLLPFTPQQYGAMEVKTGVKVP